MEARISSYSSIVLRKHEFMLTAFSCLTTLPFFSWLAESNVNWVGIYLVLDRCATAILIRCLPFANFLVGTITIEKFAILLLRFCFINNYPPYNEKGIKCSPNLVSWLKNEFIAWISVQKTVFSMLLYDSSLVFLH